ncbi:MAG: hypothetical protein CSYNP_02398 [Syntrophus sp. SKADARSKE-3]|nr:hypothetical protein [Syntrophus sp. SKADARSKE-3]
MNTISSETLGDYLKQEREARLMSVTAVSKALKVDPAWVHAVEDNDFRVFSSKDDIADFLKRYAAFLLIDGDDLVRRYETQPKTIQTERACSDGASAPASVRVPAGVLSMPGRPDEKALQKRRIRLGILGVAIAIPLIVLGIYTLSYREPVKILKDDLYRAEKSVASHIPHRPPPVAAPATKVIGNSDSMRYHLPGMKYYNQVHAYHRVEFDSEEAAIKAGYHKAAQ